MRTTTRQTGIISYAGLDEEALWAGAKRAFAQADGKIPPRFRSFLPIFPVELIVNMSYVGDAPGNRARVSPEGFSMDEAEYHQKLCAELPCLYAGDNARRCFAPDGRFRGGVVTVDGAWAAMFPQYRPFLGERLVVYLIGGGHQAVAVPESVFPRGGGVLAGVERELRITARCAHVTAYIKARIAMGERYDPARFEEDYLRVNELGSVCVRQKQLSRVMQDLSILSALEGGAAREPELFTLNARRAGGVRQYAPWRYACDTFERAPVTRGAAKLAQLCFDGDPFLSDLWMPYQDFSEYIDRQTHTVDAYALCHGFQIAPAYDARTGGGRYPEKVRVAVVRDRELHPMVAEAINNPAYGSGTGPLGLMNKLIYLPGSRELLRQNRLALEETALKCEHTTVDATEYGRMRAQAALQEWKGRLIDAMYREESVLAQMQAGTPAYARAEGALARRIEALEACVERAAARCESAQLSGYDADLTYLRRLRQYRMAPVGDDGEENAPFAADALREMCIESGFAMRACVREYALDELLVPEGNPPARRDEPSAMEAGAPGNEALTAVEAEEQASAPARQSGGAAAEEPPAAMTGKEPARRVRAKRIAGPHKMPRFEQIDMFAALGTPPAQEATEAGPASPAAGEIAKAGPIPPAAGEPAQEPAAAPEPEPPRPAYVLRTLKQLAGERREAAPGKMARLMKETHK